MAERSAKWSVFDRIKSFPSTPEGLMSEISVAISAHEYAYSTALLESATVSSNSEEENTCGLNKSHTPSQHYSAKMADEAYKAGCAALAAGKLDDALQCLNVALCKCPPEKTSAVAKLQSLISLTSQQLRKSPTMHEPGAKILDVMLAMLGGIYGGGWLCREACTVQVV